jgi:hypothetical protein
VKFKFRSALRRPIAMPERSKKFSELLEVESGQAPTTDFYSQFLPH